MTTCVLKERCGGCSLQSMGYEAQLESKSADLLKALTSIGCAAEAVHPVVGLTDPWGHRTKLLMSAGNLGKALRFGFYRRGSMHLVPAEGCPIQHSQALAVLAMARQVLEGHEVTASRAKSKEGWLHALGVRVDPSSQTSELSLSGRTPWVPGGKTLIQQLAELPGVISVHCCVSPKRSSYPMEGPFKRLAGRRRHLIHLGGHGFSLSPGTFFQTSLQGTERLIQVVLEMLPDKMESLADLYAGAGIFSLLTADRWRRAVAVEASDSAISDLEHHLQHRPPPRRLQVIADRVEQQIDWVLDQGPEVVLLDPPRRGCAQGVITSLVAHKPPVILYVSCDLESLVRDARGLVQEGYTLTAARGVDMFPHTPQLEVVARFESSVKEEISDR